MTKNLKFLLIILLSVTMLTSCKAFKPKKVDTREVPIRGDDRARKAIKEGGGIGIGNVLKKRGTNFEFSSSNPMWRASLETLDFLPLTTVDYSGGVIITDWYSEDGNNRDSIKITIRFLSNEIRSDSVKIIVHKKTCDNNLNCATNVVTSNLIRDELRSTILRKASLLEKADKKKKK